MHGSDGKIMGKFNLPTMETKHHLLFMNVSKYLDLNFTIPLLPTLYIFTGSK